MKTRDKIIRASIDLFNEKGERNITTNHIAAHLSISPGNLYYHFRNKEDIILSIYEEYARTLLLDIFPVVSKDVKALDALILYMDAVFQAMIKFRFLYSNLSVLLSKNPKNKLDLHEKPDSGVYVRDLSFFAVKSTDEINDVLRIGMKNRSVGSTLMNAVSSRSHSLF